ncbi:hypothetical protein WJX73_001858 [Symbiochloris irregularis]|uniref:Uncharacterized protein n=1 Tax=Symbiochloris irregularis TaxID=706552 RepID=A0AAW1PAT1_9CHLO
MNNLTLPIIARDLGRVGLGCGQLGLPTVDEPSFPLRGMLWQEKKRPFFEMIIQWRGRRIKLPMFVDTGGRSACLNEVSWEALAPGINLTEWNERIFKIVQIQGVQTELYLGMGRTSGVNAVGCEWLSRARLILVADYSHRGCILIKSDEATRQALPGLPQVMR